MPLLFPTTAQPSRTRAFRETQASPGRRLAAENGSKFAYSEKASPFWGGNVNQSRNEGFCSARNWVDYSLLTRLRKGGYVFQGVRGNLQSSLKINEKTTE